MKQAQTLIKDLNLTFFDNFYQPLWKFGIKNSVIVFGIGVFLFISNALGFCKGITLCMFGYLYPVQKTAEIYVGQQKDKGEQSRWFAYWAISSFILIFDQYLAYIPFFSTLQPLILLYLWHPKYCGAKKIMQSLLDISCVASDIPNSLLKPKWYQKLAMKMSNSSTVNKIIEKIA